MTAAVGYALLSFLGILIGGWVAETGWLSDRGISIALHAAAGMILAVVGAELMPRIVKSQPFWVSGTAFIAGGMLSVLAGQWLTSLEKTGAGPHSFNRGWMIYAAVATDLFSDGILIGAGSHVSRRLALLIAGSMILGDVPPGVSVLATFRQTGRSVKSRWLALSGLSVFILAGTGLAFALAGNKSAVVKAALLAFTAAILVKVTVEEMLASAHNYSPESAWQSAAFILGFAFFIWLAAYLPGV